MADLMLFIWVIGWLFTCGAILAANYNQPIAQVIGKCLLALIIWPGYLGSE